MIPLATSAVGHGMSAIRLGARASSDTARVPGDSRGHPARAPRGTADVRGPSADFASGIIRPS